ncbi:hypothetical protein NC651_036572 [Populus alba x Populus x berolinensis]|nr:hypothetical protein NC651_036572 [Populus alba x Populus x berolinensis]
MNSAKGLWKKLEHTWCWRDEDDGDADFFFCCWCGSDGEWQWLLDEEDDELKMALAVLRDHSLKACSLTDAMLQKMPQPLLLKNGCMEEIMNDVHETAPFQNSIRNF